jgi:nucleotide-binding universal stress UspA family protein
MIARVAVGTDGSATAAEAVRMAAAVAGAFGAELVLVSAYSESDQRQMDRGDAETEVQWSFSPAARMRELLARTEEEVRRDGVACRTMMDEGDPAEVLVRLAEECGADMLVIGNKGMQRRVLGSVPNTVTHRAPCAVMVVKTT